jgi:hypothetical protein
MTDGLTAQEMLKETVEYCLNHKKKNIACQNHIRDKWALFFAQFIQDFVTECLHRAVTDSEFFSDINRLCWVIKTSLNLFKCNAHIDLGYGPHTFSVSFGSWFCECPDCKQDLKHAPNQCFSSLMHLKSTHASVREDMGNDKFSIRHALPACQTNLQSHRIEQAVPLNKGRIVSV